MATVTFKHATRTYPGTTTPAVDDINLEIQDGEFLVLVGPSGCGKSTTLRMVAGLEAVTDGSIFIDDTDVTDLPARNRDVAMVFQSYALYPNMTVAQNMAFALNNAKVPKAEIETRLKEAARILQLEDLMQRKPGALSGGQRQRVAMGRAIVRSPKVFCMDEPLSNLDAKLRVSTRAEITALQKRLGVTTIYVTHDQVEAMTMGDRVAVLSAGKLQQVDPPTELYENPVNLFVAGFIGSPAIALFDGKREGNRVRIGGMTVPLPDNLAREAGERVTVGIRPEGWIVAGRDDAGANTHDDTGIEGELMMTIEIVERLGSESFLYAQAKEPLNPISDGNRIAIRRTRHTGIAVGDEVPMYPILKEMRFFDTDSGLSLHR